MSYCVNCGVELDGTLTDCPLCNTPVINPREIKDSARKPTFPEEKQAVEAVKRKDVGILMTTVVVACAVTCGLLNLLVLQSSPWSLAIIGICVLLWVLLIPVTIYNRQSIYLSILFDGLAVGIYLYMLSYMLKSDNWLWGLGVPIVILVTIVGEILTMCIRKLPRSILTVALYCFTAIAFACIGLEILIDRYIKGMVSLSWSAIVLTVCVIVDIAIITILSRRRLRSAVRRRLHF